MQQHFLVVAIGVMVVTLTGAFGHVHTRTMPKYKILERIVKSMSFHNHMVLPLEDDPVTIKTDMSLVDLLDVDVAKHEITMVLWKYDEWTDKRLAWDLSTYNMTHVNIEDRNNIWTPDITIYNQIRQHEYLSPGGAVVNHLGHVIHAPSVKVTIGCDVRNIGSHSGATCHFTLGSWTYDASTIKLANPTENSFRDSHFLKSSRYEVLKLSTEKKTHYFVCCPESPFDTIRFTFVVREKKLE